MSTAAPAKADAGTAEATAAPAKADAGAAEAAPPFSLALSGGGFRATLFHLGVIRYLYEQEILHGIDQIASVSGGSVLAAHLVLHWGDYTNYERPDRFKERADQVIRFVRKGIRDQIFIRWLLTLVVPGFVVPISLIMLAAGGILVPYWAWVLVPLFMLLAVVVYVWGLFARSRALTNKYTRLFESKKLEDLGVDVAPGRPRPALFMNTTSLTTGELCCFTSQGFHRAADFFGSPDYPIAKAVAASSAFPPAFDPIKLTAEELGKPMDSSKPPKPRFPDYMRLTDGGVYDNLGLDALKVFGRSGAPLAKVILSDAQQPFGQDYHEPYQLLVVRAVRATDIMMYRISEFQVPSGAKLVEVRLRDTIPAKESLVGENHQGDVQRVRTDLDAFSSAEVQMLVYQGYAVARRAFGRPRNPGMTLTDGGMPCVFPPPEVGPPDPKRPWLPYEKAELGRNWRYWRPSRAEELSGSSRRRIVQPLLTSLGVWLCVGVLLVLLWHVRVGQYALPRDVRPTYKDPKAQFPGGEAPDYQLLTLFLTSREKEQPFAVWTKSLGDATPRLLGLVRRKPLPFRCVVKWKQPASKVVVVLARRPTVRLPESPNAEHGAAPAWRFQELGVIQSRTDFVIHVPDPEPDDQLLFYGWGADLSSVELEDVVKLKVGKWEGQ
jgi:predicted acylesterase/phospholipase RssA